MGCAGSRLTWGCCPEVEQTCTALEDRSIFTLSTPRTVDSTGGVVTTQIGIKTPEIDNFSKPLASDGLNLRDIDIVLAGRHHFRCIWKNRRAFIATSSNLDEDHYGSKPIAADTPLNPIGTKLPKRRKRRGMLPINLVDELPLKKVATDSSLDDSGTCSAVTSPERPITNLEMRTSTHRTNRSTPEAPLPPNVDDWLRIFDSWSHKERLIAINELIYSCDPLQVRHMMDVIEPQFQRDFISLLPKELSLYVLSFLDPKDLLRAAQTCQYWRVLADDNLLWREKFREAGICHRRAMSDRVHGHWKSIFLRHHNVELNWRFRPIRPSKVLKGHDEHVITCLQFSGNRVVSGSDDNTLKVWSIITGKALKTLLGHTGGVWSSQMQGNLIISGSTDRTLRVWNAENGRCLHTLYGHTSTVRCMCLHGKKVVSGSRDATLRLWDVDSGECLHVLVGHIAAVRCVQYNGKLVVSGAYDYVVRVWDPETETCLHQLQGHANRVYSLQFDGAHIISGSLDTTIRVWDVENGSCKHVLTGHQSLTSGMELRGNTLVSGNADSTVKIWDITTGQCLLTLTGPHKHSSAVTCLQLVRNFVITSSDDGTVKLWDLKTGVFIRNLVQLSGSAGVVWRIRASETKLVCAVGSRNGTEETKLLVLDFDTESNLGCS